MIVMPGRPFLLLASTTLALVTFTTRGVEDFKIIPFVIDNHAGQASCLLQARQRDAEIIRGYFK